MHPFRVIAVPAAVAAAALVSALPAAASMQPAAGFHRALRVAVPAAQLPAFVPAVTGDLTLSVSKTKIAYRKSVTVTAHLGNADENPVVSIFRTPAGGSPVLVASGAVNVNGDLKATVTLTRNSSFTAHWDGDGTHDPTDTAAASGRRSCGDAGRLGQPSVRPLGRVPAVPLPFLVRQQRQGLRCLGGEGEADPRRRERHLRAAAKAAPAAGMSAGSLSLSLNSQSAAAVRFRYAKSLIGTSFRFVARFAGDSSNLGGTTKFAYFRVTS